MRIRIRNPGKNIWNIVSGINNSGSESFSPSGLFLSLCLGHSLPHCVGFPSDFSAKLLVLKKLFGSVSKKGKFKIGLGLDPACFLLHPDPILKTVSNCSAGTFKRVTFVHIRLSSLSTDNRIYEYLFFRKSAGNGSRVSATCSWTCTVRGGWGACSGESMSTIQGMAKYSWACAETGGWGACSGVSI